MDTPQPFLSQQERKAVLEDFMSYLYDVDHSTIAFRFGDKHPKSLKDILRDRFLVHEPRHIATLSRKDASTTIQLYLQELAARAAGLENEPHVIIQEPPGSGIYKAIRPDEKVASQKEKKIVEITLSNNLIKDLADFAGKDSAVILKFDTSIMNISTSKIYDKNL